MLKIRLQRTGRKHDPTYRVVLTDSKNGPKSGKFIEILGNYDARRNDETVLKGERIQYWIGQGAKPSDTVHNLLVKSGIIKGETRNVLPKKTPIVNEEEAKEESAPVESESSEETPSEDAPAEEEKAEEAPVEETKEEEVKEEKSEETKEEVPAETESEDAPKEEKEEENK